MKIPTHEEVASVLDGTHQDIADFVRNNSDEKRDCWGDLIMRVQHEFDLHDVATAFRRLSMKGWKRHIVLTWCPLTTPLWKAYVEARKGDGKRSRSIHGKIALVRDLWTRTRKAWMRKWCVASDDDPMFFNCIVLYLEKVKELGDAKNNRTRTEIRN
jgi:hypothetical protein